MSQGFLKTSRNNYLANSERGSFEFNEVGLNFTENLGDQLRVGMQLFMRDLGPLGDYKPQVDWAYIDQRFFDWLGLRAGRIKIPFGLYNEVNDIDAARQPVLLPQSVYPTQSRDYLLAQTGFELYGRTPYSRLGSLEYRAYGGTIYLDTRSAEAIERFDVPYVAGGRLMWETPLDGLRVGGTYQALQLRGDAILDSDTLVALQESGALSANADNRVPFRIPVQLWVTSAEYAAHNLLVAAEYGRWTARVTSDEPSVFPSSRTQNERMYVMASYQIASWFAPGGYYALWFPDVSDRRGRDRRQHDAALTLRFDPSDNWLVKVEGHYMNGTANLSSALNDDAPLRALAKDWLLFLLKTTAYF